MDEFKGFPDPLKAYLTFLALDEARNQLMLKPFELNAYGSIGFSTAYELKTKLMVFNERYSAGYKAYSAVIREARKSAQSKQEWIDILAGIAIGVGVGLLAEALLGAAAVTTVAEMALGVGSEMVEAGVGIGVKKIMPKVAGQDLDPTGVHPALVESRIWQKLAELFREIAIVQHSQSYLGNVMGNIEFALAQFNLIKRGLPLDSPWTKDDLMTFAASLLELKRTITAIDLSKKINAMRRIQTQAATYKVTQPRKVEQDIWLFWMSSLDDPDILDIDAIEDHLNDIDVLGEASRCNVDFGRWTSKDDEVEAINAAKREVRQIKDAYNLING